MENLAVKNVSMDFSNGKLKTNALKNLKLTANKNEITVILGPSGCGKSTLLNIIAGFMRPTKGKIILGKNEVIKPTSDIGIVFQEPNLFPWLNVEQNIAFGPKMKSQKADYNELISQIGLEGFEKHFPFMLSLGMQQRVAIARAIVNKPKILLMDEPFSALDHITKGKMHELVLNIKSKTKNPIIFVTHDIEEALFLADKIYVMSERPGKIKAAMSNPLPKKIKQDIKFSKNFIELRKEISNLMLDETIKQK